MSDWTEKITMCQNADDGCFDCKNDADQNNRCQTVITSSAVALHSVETQKSAFFILELVII